MHPHSHRIKILQPDQGLRRALGKSARAAARERDSDRILPAYRVNIHAIYKPLRQHLNLALAEEAIKRLGDPFPA